MKKLPLGISDYKELIDEGYYYVDKTLLIKELFECGKVILMPRPRRFGKTLNLTAGAFARSSAFHSFIWVGPIEYLVESSAIVKLLWIASRAIFALYSALNLRLFIFDPIILFWGKN